MINTKCGLNQDALIFFSLMAGSSDHQGVPGCGTSISFGLAKCGFGGQLMDAIQSLSPVQLETFRVFAGFQAAIRQELATNSHGHFASHHEKLSACLPESFLDPQILGIYSSSPKTSLFGHWTNKWVPREPSISSLAKFGQENFGWITEGSLKYGMSSEVWQGAFLQMIYSVRDSLSDYLCDD